MKKQLTSSLYIPSVKVGPNGFSTTNNTEKSCILPPKKIEFARNSIKRIVHHANNNNTNSNATNFNLTDNKLTSTTQITVKPIFLNKNQNNDQNLIPDKNRHIEKSPKSNCIPKQQQNTTVSLKQHQSNVSLLKFFF